MDDDRETRESIGEALRVFAGWNVETFASGAAALKGLTRERPDVMVTDFRMPEMDGIQLTRAALKVAPGLRVLMITAFDDEDLRTDALGAGVCQVVPKPLDVEDLVEAVRQCITPPTALEKPDPGA